LLSHAVSYFSEEGHVVKNPLKEELTMKKLIFIVAALIVISGFSTTRLANAKHEKKGRTKGEIVKVQGELVKGKEGSVTLKDKKGKLHTFKFDQVTEMDGRLGAKTGLTIDVMSEEGGHAISIIDKAVFNDVFLPDFLTLPVNPAKKPKPKK